MSAEQPASQSRRAATTSRTEPTPDHLRRVDLRSYDRTPPKVPDRLQRSDGVGLLYRGDLNLVFAQSGAGKTIATVGFDDAAVGAECTDPLEERGGPDANLGSQFGERGRSARQLLAHNFNSCIEATPCRASLSAENDV